jgi:hypothetical protein
MIENDAFMETPESKTFAEIFCEPFLILENWFAHAV